MHRYTLSVLEPRPVSHLCVMRGFGLNWAIAREPATFWVEFVDALGQVAHAEEVDVHVERLKLLTPPSFPAGFPLVRNRLSIQPLAVASQPNDH